MKNRLYLIVVILYLFLPAVNISVISAGVYYVSVDGTASWSESTNIETPCSLSMANSNVRAGDTVYIRGGTYNSGEFIRPENSGTSENARITYCNYNNENVTITEANYGILLDGISYITVNGLNFYWLEKFLYIKNSANYNIISYCTFDKARNHDEWTGSIIYYSSQYNWVHHCTFSRWGYYDGSHNGSTHRGSLFDVGSVTSATDETFYNLIEDNTFYSGSHHVLGAWGQYNIFRNNYMHNEGWELDKDGYRCAITHGKATGKNLFEGNHFAFAGKASGMSLRSRNNIFRFNTFYNNGLGGIQCVSMKDLTPADYNHIYNNVFYNNGHEANYQGFSGGIYFCDWGQGDPTGNVVKNNIFYGNMGGPITFDGCADPQVIENNWETGNPLFVYDGSSLYPFGDKPDFRLRAESPCIDSGAPLTRLTSANGSGTQFEVEDAWYFIDGFGIVEGDKIQLYGSSDRVKIINIDYSTNEITVDQTISWYYGQGVSLPYKDDYPDMGAYEYEITGTITGTVTDSITGNPIEGATVTDGTRTEVTDASGNYTIEYVPFNQAYKVSASKTGYFPLSFDSVVVVAAEDSTTIVDFQLIKVPTGTISGTVTDSITGDPVQGAMVTDGIRSDTTDIIGNYSLADVPVDTFMITVSISDYLPLMVEGVVVVKDIITIVDLHLQRVPTGTISGTVFDAATGHPVEGALVSNETTSVTTDAGGTYFLPEVLVDTFTITVSASGYKPVSMDGVVVTANDTSRVDFQLTAFPDLVGFWAFEESSGTTAYDSSANHNDGFIHGPTITTGMSDLALQFDGTDDYVTIPKSISLDDITKEITLMAWIWVSSGSRHSIFERWLSGPGVEERSFLFDVKKDHVYFGLSGDGTNSDSRFLLSSGSVPSETWTHVAATSDGSEMKIYINGIPDPETKTSPTSIHPSAADLHIGQGEFVTNGWDYPFNGTMDQVKIYNRALSAQEVEADFHLAFVGNRNTLAPVNGVLEAYPNPFSYATTISYRSKVTGKVTISIYNTSGQNIRTLISAAQQEDHHSVVWNGTHTSGEPAGSGVYCCKINVDDKPVGTTKLILLR